MAKIPRQHPSRMGGEDGHRKNRAAFRAAGGNVKPPSKSWFPCGVVILAGLVGLTGIGTAVFNQFT